MEHPHETYAPISLESSLQYEVESGHMIYITRSHDKAKELFKHGKAKEACCTRRSTRQLKKVTDVIVIDSDDEGGVKSGHSLSVVKCCGIPLTKEDLATLQPTQWLNDQVKKYSVRVDELHVHVHCNELVNVSIHVLILLREN